MSRAVPQQTLEWLHRVLVQEYHDVNRTFTETVKVLQTYPSLHPRTSVHTFEDGRSQLLLNLHGTLPASFRSTVYHIPVSIWIPHEFPLQAPFGFVTPTANMNIRPGNHVDTNGKIYHPYLSYWNPQSSSLVEVTGILIDVFSKEPPVYGKPVQAQAPSNPPLLPLQSLMPSQPSVHPLQPEAAREVAQTNSAYSSRISREISSKQGPASPIQPVLSPPLLSTAPFPQSTSQLQVALSTSVGELSNLLDESTAEELTPATGPPLPMHPEHINLLNEVGVALQRKATASQPDLQKQSEQLKSTLEMLSQTEANLAREKSELERITDASNRNKKFLIDRLSRAEKVISEAHKQSQVNVDELITAEAAVFNQVYELAADDLAINDTIYVLGKALDRERISLDIFLKHTRTLAREQFLKRALVKKIAASTGLQ
ncbi:UEV domain-containing protein [Lipomyces oligophaga]|uniref:UEV domain-containing protein n=1 Tax=Lipomyces oligophaga TaxID=45792 RepID=UPI0034CEF306